MNIFHKTSFFAGYCLGDGSYNSYARQHAHWAGCPAHTFAFIDFGTMWMRLSLQDVL